MCLHLSWSLYLSQLYYWKLGTTYDSFPTHSGVRPASEQRECVKKSSFQSQPDSIRSDEESEYTYEDDDEEEEEAKDISEKLEADSSYEARAEKALEDPSVSKEVSPDLVRGHALKTAQATPPKHLKSVVEPRIKPFVDFVLWRNF